MHVLSSRFIADFGLGKHIVGLNYKVGHCIQLIRGGTSHRGLCSPSVLRQELVALLRDRGLLRVQLLRHHYAGLVRVD